MVRLKEQHRHWGPKKIREVYLRQWGEAPSESSFKRVLERAGMVEKRRRTRLAANSARLHSGRRGQEANEVWTVDFKGWWHDPEGKRCEPLTVRDEHSRYILDCHRMGSARTEAVWERFERLFSPWEPFLLSLDLGRIATGSSGATSGASSVETAPSSAERSSCVASDT